MAKQRNLFLLLCTLTALPVVCAALTSFGRAETSSAAGRQLFEKRCSGCHAMEKEMEGPHLRGVYGRVAGSVTSFQYSEALKSSGIMWNAETLDRWLTDPENLVPGNDMAFHVEKPDERRQIIAYLRNSAAK